MLHCWPQVRPLQAGSGVGAGISGGSLVTAAAAMYALAWVSQPTAASSHVSATMLELHGISAARLRVTAPPMKAV